MARSTLTRMLKLTATTRSIQRVVRSYPIQIIAFTWASSITVATPSTKPRHTTPKSTVASSAQDSVIRSDSGPRYDVLFSTARSSGSSRRFGFGSAGRYCH